MGMKYRIKKLDEVAENLRSMYKADGEEFVLDVEGAVGREQLDEFRTNNIQLKTQLEKLKDVDPVKYQELIQLDNQVKEGKLIKEGKLEEVVNLRVGAMKTDYDAKLSARDNELKKANGQLGVLIIDNAVKTAAIKAGVVATAVDDVVLRARGLYQVENGTAVPKGADGAVIYGKDGKTPMPAEEWVTGLKATAPHLFQGTQGSGAGGGARAGVQNPNLSSVDKIQAGLAAGGLLGNLPMETAS